jgi:flagella basal body P-ring formation protein FlgA
MIRLAASTLLLLAATSIACAQTPSLRPTVLVSGDLVRIGDLVADVAPEKAQIAIFRAPDLGETGSVRAAIVIEALRPHAVTGIEENGLSEVSVTRASRMVGAAEIKDRIAEIAAERLGIGDRDRIAVTIDGSAPMIHRETSETGALMPLRASFEPRTGRFDLTFRSGAAPVRLTGNAQEAQEAVVLTRAVPRGEVLRESDVTIEKRPKSELHGEVLREITAVVGMASQQSLRPGQVLRASDVAKPQLVKRSEPVVIVYEVPGITLTARGKAEDAGALGDTVNVLNVQSKRVVQGVVTAPGQITVTSLTPRVGAAVSNIASRNAATKAE